MQHQARLEAVLNATKPKVLVRIGDDLYRRPKDDEVALTTCHSCTSRTLTTQPYAFSPKS